MKYRFIFLDLDGTIMDFDACEALAFRRAIEASGYAYSDQLYRTYHELNALLWERHERGELTRERLLTLRFDLLFEQSGIKGDSLAFEKRYRDFLADGHLLEKDALLLLKNLKDSPCRVYIASNGVSETQQKRLKDSGILKYVDEVFVSEKIGWQKPKKEYFDCCFSMIPGFDRERAVMIGDSLSADIQGGINAGIATCWYNPKGKVSASVRPDMEAHSLKEVWELLQGKEEDRNEH